MSLLVFASSLVNAATIFVPAGGDLQGAINSAGCGDDIVLQAGATFSGNFALRYKGLCSSTDADYINVHTSNLSGIPASGTRITPTNASAMAKLVAASSEPALEAEANAHHYKLIGIEITNVGGSIVTQELVLLGARSSGGGIPFNQHPHHITFDRCWIHEATNDTTTPSSIVTTAIRGFNLDATDITITESRIAGFRTYQPLVQGVEASNAILFPSSALRVMVRNSFLEAWFCPVFFGGSGGSTPNAATLTSPVFDANTHLGSAIFSSVLNLSTGDLLAMKTTGGRTPATNHAHPNEAVAFQVVKVTGINDKTVSFQSWGTFDGDLSSGNPLLQTPDAPGLAQWNGYLNQDITLQSNQFVENFASTEQVWVSTGGSPTTLPRSTQQNTGNAPKGMIEIKMAKNLLINGNTFEGWQVGFTVTSRNQGSTLTSGGFPWAGVFNVTISNNWWKRMRNWDRINGYPVGGPQLEDNEYSNVRSGPFKLANNLIESGVGPILGLMTAADNVTVVHNTYPGSDLPPGDSMLIGAGPSSPNLIFKDNILGNNEYGMSCQSVQPCWPNLTQNHNVIVDNRSSDSKISDGTLGNRYPNDFIVANQAGVGWIDTANVNYALDKNSPFKGQASDGTDPGVNMSTLLAALSGSSPTASPTPTPAPTPTPNASPSPTPTGEPAIGSRVTVDTDGVLVRSGPSISYAVIGTQGTSSRGTIDQPCVSDPVSPRVFCHVGFDAGVSGSLTIEHLVLLSTPTSSPPIWLGTLNGNVTGPLVAVNDGRQTVENPIAITTQENFGTDKRTRLIIYALGVSSLAANADPTNDIFVDGLLIPNLAESVIVEADTQDGHVYRLPVEFAGALRDCPGLDQINIVLIPELQDAGSVALTVIVNGQRSNAPTIVVR